MSFNNLTVYDDNEAYRKEVVSLKKEIEGLKQLTYCAYCGFTVPIDDDASLISEHIKTCEKHPIRELESDNVALKKEIDWCNKNLENFRYEGIKCEVENVKLNKENQRLKNIWETDESVNTMFAKSRAKLTEKDKEIEKLKEGSAKYTTGLCIDRQHNDLQHSIQVLREALEKISKGDPYQKGPTARISWEMVMASQALRKLSNEQK